MTPHAHGAGLRVAALYDIHGNAPALEAVLAEVLDLGVDLVVVGGDVLPGPLPRETLAALDCLSVPVRYLRGNGEREVLAARAGQRLDAVPPAFREAVRWVAEAVPAAAVARLQAWPATLRLAVAGVGEVLFCHATPESDSEIFTASTDEARLLPIFGGAAADLVVCGHTHMQFDRWVGDTRVVNAGSVGMPFGEPGAYWLLVGPVVELRRTTYDLAAAAERIRASAYPQRESFAEANVLAPPAAAYMQELFEQAAR